ncbi:carbohydrate sulfotransferase 14-like [Glandiceps talaboti]
MFSICLTRRHGRQRTFTLCMLLIICSTAAFLFVVSFSSPERRLTSRILLAGNFLTRTTDPVQPNGYDSSKPLPWPTRQKRLNAMCKYNNKKNVTQLTQLQKKILYTQVLVNDKYKFLYCFVPKVACSNWKRVIKVIDGYITDVDKSSRMDHRSGLVHLGDLSDSEIEYRLKNYYKFMFVREPLSRLLSAYRNKFGEKFEDFIRRYGKYIVRRYRPDAGPAPQGDDVTFTEYVQYLTEANLNQMDIHWMPMHELCQPCIINYDFVGNFENLDEDVDHVLKTTGAAEVVHFPKRQRYYHPTSQDMVEEEYMKVPEQYIDELIAKYVMDFALFSYPIQKFDHPHATKEGRNISNLV